MEQKLITQKVMTIRELPDDEKPRERLAKYSASSLSNSELLAIILAKGTRNKNVVDLSKEMLSKYNIREMSEQSVNELCKVKGIGFAKACQIVACFELGKRLASYTSENNPYIRCSGDAYKILSPFFRNQVKENFIALFLDTRKRLSKYEVLFIGTLDSSIVHPREIFKSAVKESASSIIVMHNHPSGDITPSKEDIEITKIIIDAGKLMSIPLLDHIIIGANGFRSLREEPELRELF